MKISAGFGPVKNQIFCFQVYRNMVEENRTLPTSADNFYGESLSHKSFLNKVGEIRAKNNLHPKKIACCYTYAPRLYLPNLA